MRTSFLLIFCLFFVFSSRFAVGQVQDPDDVIDLRIENLTPVYMPEGGSEIYAYVIDFSHDVKPICIYMPKGMVFEVIKEKLTLKDSMGGKFSEGGFMGKSVFTEVTFSPEKYPKWGLMWGFKFSTHEGSTEGGFNDLQTQVRKLAVSIFETECEGKGKSRTGHFMYKSTSGSSSFFFNPSLKTAFVPGRDWDSSARLLKTDGKKLVLAEPAIASMQRTEANEKKFAGMLQNWLVVMDEKAKTYKAEKDGAPYLTKK